MEDQNGLDRDAFALNAEATRNSCLKLVEGLNEREKKRVDAQKPDSKVKAEPALPFEDAMRKALNNLVSQLNAPALTGRIGGEPNLRLLEVALQDTLHTFGLTNFAKGRRSETHESRLTGIVRVQVAMMLARITNDNESLYNATLPNPVAEMVPHSARPEVN